MKNTFKNHIAELHNITWPTRKQAIHSMITVIIVMLIIGTFLSFLDSILSKTLSNIL